MRLGGQAIDIRHQLIAQLGIILHRLVRRRSFRSDIIDLAARILPVATEQRTESSELIPTVVQLPPFPQILATFLSGHITVLHAEATDIHRPVRDTGHGEVQAGADLRFHILPASTDITTPCSGRVTLLAGETGTGQQEYTVIRVYATLSVVDRLGVLQGIRVEVFRGRAQISRSAKRLPVFDVRIILYVRLGSIHPPSVDAQGIQMLVHLFPEKLAGFRVVRIIERTDITRINPVADTILNRLLIHGTQRVQLFIMLCRIIKLRPYGDHDTGILIVDLLNHTFRVREAFLIKLMAAPRIYRPIAPVLYDHIQGDLPPAVLVQGTQ